MDPLRAATFAAALLGGMAWGTALAAQRPAAILLDTAELQAPRLSESSGIIPSRRRPGVFWTHNDSGDGPYLYATDSAGTNLGKVRVQGATTIDWEDISSGACTRSEGTCLFIGDIGDNNSRRPWITVYVVPEPEPPSGGPGDTLRFAAVEDTITLRYPDRPHDAEAMAVIGGWVYVITKDRTSPPVLYRSPTRVTGPRVLSPVGTLPISTGLLRGRLVTGAAASADGKVLVARTYVSLHFFALTDGAPTPLTDRDGIVIPVVEAQGEGVCFDDRGRLVLTGERGRVRHAILARVQVSGLATP
jgi:hypothetical protein